MLTRTFAMLKPTTVKDRIIGHVIDWIDSEDFDVLEMRRTTLTRHQAEALYEKHRERDFFPSLITYTTSGPVMLLLLERDNAIGWWRKILGHTDPRRADHQTIRAAWGNKEGVIWENVAHGSADEASAAREIALFFGPATRVQPTPEHNDGPSVWDLVMADVRSQVHLWRGAPAESLTPIVLADMAARDAMGRAKYGVTLQPNNSRNALTDAYQEALDKTVYLRQALESDTDPTLLLPLYRGAIAGVFALRSAMIEIGKERMSDKEYGDLATEEMFK